MAVRNRSSQTTYVDEINSAGVATQVELDNAILYHNTRVHKIVDNIEYFLNDNNQYISKQLFNRTFFDNDSTTSNIYLYTEKYIRCTDSIFRLPFNKNFILDKIQVDLDSDVTGDIIDIEDEDLNILYTVHIDNAKTIVIEDLNIELPAKKGVYTYVNGTSLRKPIVTLWFRLIHTD